MQRTPEELFDPRFYLRSTGSLDPSINPWAHYCAEGWRNGLNPHPLFDAGAYQTPHDIEPMQHYFEIGWKEGRNPHPLFHTSYYMAENPYAGLPEINPLIHFLEIGGFEGRDPNPAFSCEAYLSAHPELRVLGINPLVHAILNAWRTEKINARDNLPRGRVFI